MAITAQPDQPGQREPRRISWSASTAARQTVMGINTWLAAQNATTVAFLKEVARGRSTASQ
jgi:hypothetical protein